ncbi:MAG TPA: hypothetical protein PKD34_01240 [Candidatus Doudnabacteria bacterium]|jgi:uncharacterized tellurite resistance protein B-like protein|nr:hypothetical protein [Cytophagales bacterium]HMR55200.1 hypothetical protein [Candidatus Doudnabacteria bacterium]HRE68395.1 hypothetical protein [Cyclobacteriaceae bacterium]HRF32897.1 hypothetical protein [Cyclobacteriaceae bacterium]
MIVLEQLKLLVNLARIDGEMASRERAFIINIGKAHGFPESSVETLFYSSHETILAKELTNNQKFEYIFNLVQLMKMDERLYEEEIKFCANTATKLGYKPEVMFELMLKIKSTEMTTEEKTTLQKLTAQYLN